MARSYLLDTNLSRISFRKGVPTINMSHNMCVIECLHGKVNGEEEKDDEEAFTFTPEAGQLVNKDSGRMMESSQLANHRPL